MLKRTNLLPGTLVYLIRQVEMFKAGHEFYINSRTVHPNMIVYDLVDDNGEKLNNVKMSDLQPC